MLNLELNFVCKEIFDFHPFVGQNILQGLSCHGNTDVLYASQCVHESSAAPKQGVFFNEQNTSLHEVIL